MAKGSKKVRARRKKQDRKKIVHRDYDFPAGEHPGNARPTKERIARGDAEPEPGQVVSPELGKPLAIEEMANIDEDHGPAYVIVYRAPDHLWKLFKQRTLNQGQFDTAGRWHEAFIRARLDPRSAITMDRAPGKGDPLQDTVLDAKHEIWDSYDHLGGRNRLGSRVLFHIVGMGETIEDTVQLARGREGWLNRFKVGAVLATALDAVEGFYLTRRRLLALKRDAVKGAGNGALSEMG